MSVKRGDVVLYLLQGRTLNAIVLATRSSEVAHLGSKDEPLVSLAFSDPARETGLAKDPDTGEYVYPFGRVPQIFIEHDVVHESHEFSEEFKRDKGIATDAQIAAARGLGEYRETDDNHAGEVITRLRSMVTDFASRCRSAEDEVLSQKGRAELAESVSESLRKELEALKGAASADPDAGDHHEAAE